MKSSNQNFSNGYANFHSDKVTVSFPMESTLFMKNMSPTNSDKIKDENKNSVEVGAVGNLNVLFKSSHRHLRVGFCSCAEFISFQAIRSACVFFQ